MEVKIPKEIRDYQESIFFGLSTRQFICSLLAVGVAVGNLFLPAPVGRQRRSGLDVHPRSRALRGLAAFSNTMA